MKLIVCLLALASLSACGHEYPCYSVVSAPDNSPSVSEPMGEGEDKEEDVCEYVRTQAPKAEIYFEGVVTNG